MKETFFILTLWIFCQSTLFAQNTLPYSLPETRYFPVIPKANLSFENAYYLSSLILSSNASQLASAYFQMFNGENQNRALRDKVLHKYVTSVTTGDTLFSMEMRLYSPEMVGRRYNRILILRPYDKTLRPTFLMAHGNGGNLQSWTTYYMLGVADLLMKGYAVVLYENWNSLQNLAQKDAGVPEFAAWDTLNFGDIYALEAAGKEADDMALQRAWYMLYQYAYAAHGYAAHNASVYGLDTRFFFAAGHSAGGISALLLTYADPIKQFTHPNFQPPGSFSSKTWPEIPIYTPKISAVLSSGSGLPDPESPGMIFGNIIGPEDRNKWAVMLHGKKDPAAPVDKGPALYSDFVDSVTLKGPIALAKDMSRVGILNYSLINCFGEHPVYNYPFTLNDRGGLFRNLNISNISFSSANNSLFTTDTALYQLALHGQQLNDMMQVATNVFAFKIKGQKPSLSAGIYSWQPKEFTFPIRFDKSNWQYVPSDCGIIGARLDTFPVLQASQPKLSLIFTRINAQNCLLTWDEKIQQSAILSIYDPGFQLQHQQIISTNSINMSIADWQAGRYQVMITDLKGIILAKGSILIPEK